MPVVRRTRPRARLNPAELEDRSTPAVFTVGFPSAGPLPGGGVQGPDERLVRTGEGGSTAADHSGGLQLAGDTRWAGPHSVYVVDGTTAANAAVQG